MTTTADDASFRAGPRPPAADSGKLGLSYYAGLRVALRGRLTPK
jgi:hypothetical protein